MNPEVELIKAAFKRHHPGAAQAIETNSKDKPYGLAMYAAFKNGYLEAWKQAKQK